MVIFMNSPITLSRKAADIYRQIYYHQASSRQLLANNLNISLPIIAQNVNQLLNLGLIYNAGELDSTGGRKATMFSIVPNARIAMGIDITKHYLGFVIVDLEATCIASKYLSLEFQNSNTYYQTISRIIETLLSENGISDDQFLGIGISLPGIVDTAQNRLILTSVFDSPENLNAELSKWVHRPFQFVNDANAAGWAESRNCGNKRNMVYLSLSNSVGGAIILNDQLYIGDNYRGAEFGHMTVVPNGKRCYCGRYGCLDAYCSAQNLSDYTDGDLDRFFHTIRNNQNKGMGAFFDDYLEHLAIGISNIRMCTDCDIVLGGLVGPYLEEYIDDLRLRVLMHTPFEHSAEYLRICSHTEQPSSIGAALYYIDKFVHEL